MCGIAGIVISEARRYRAAMERMVGALAHRGPDGSGVMEFDGAVLGHTRLSIVDLAGGAQPMRSAVDGRVGVTFNGEIYGYQTLRKELAGEYPFRTMSDTEVILAVYQRERGEPVVWGASLDQLPGMFAFGLWDEEERVFLAARDRFGEKPFYYARFVDEEGRAGLVFASEMKAILASGLVRPKLDRDALGHYLQNLYVHPLQTIYENVQTLGPGRVLSFYAGDLVVRRYWELPEERGEVDVTEAVEEFRRLFAQAVGRQMVADVPVGAFLSGGLDSSTVVGLAAKVQPGVQTFAFRFDKGFDETPYAAAVAAMHGTTHRVLEDTDVDIGGLMVEMAGVYDEPFADSSNIPTYLISKLAREHLKVVLTGDGGDELLAGYGWYRPLIEAGAGASISEGRLSQSRYFSDATLAKFGLAPSAMPKRIDRTHTVDDALRMDLVDYMPGDILVKIDRASMAHGLELRAPFLDVDLATFLIGLPWRLKIDGTGDKLILRKAFAALWPREIVNRPKQGFGAPVAEWLGRAGVKELVKTRLCDRRHPVFGLLPFEGMRVAVERGSFQAWILLTLALWLERHPL